MRALAISTSLVLSAKHLSVPGTALHNTEYQHTSTGLVRVPVNFLAGLRDRSYRGWCFPQPQGERQRQLDAKSENDRGYAKTAVNGSGRRQGYCRNSSSRSVNQNDSRRVGYSTEYRRRTRKLQSIREKDILPKRLAKCWIAEMICKVSETRKRRSMAEEEYELLTKRLV